MDYSRALGRLSESDEVMSGAPLVSVAMSVYNGGDQLASTLDSVLAQTGVDLEFIVINDGSTDQTGRILDEYQARDPRLHVVHQDNTGLTRALIIGCNLARGTYIARQDAGGDVSIPGRFRRQAEFLDSHPDAVMTSCGTRFVGPEGEALYEVAQSGEELQQVLEQPGVNRVQGPSHHGSTMFRKSAYQSVGGYRSAFPVAQDIDLWLRLAEAGRCVALSDILYEARWSRGSISAERRGEQVKAASAILMCAERRRMGLDEGPVLDQFTASLARKTGRARAFRSLQDARFYYFLGSVLRHKQPERAKFYYEKALRAWFLYPRALFRLLWLKGQT